MGILEQLYQACECQAVIVLNQSNTYYLSGYNSTNCQIVITKDNSYFITDKRYYLEAKNKISDKFTVLAGDYNTINDLVKSYEVIGWDDDVSYATYKQLINAYFSTKKLVPISSKIQMLRDIKKDYEISNILKAQSITELAFDEVLKLVKEGVTEIELAAYIEYVFLKNGASLAFDSIVAFGKNGASPHAHRTNKPLSKGEFITMDIGARWNGYCADMTRTIALDHVTSKMADVYDTVLQAQLKAINEIKPLMKGCECDAIARDYIKSRGYGEYFTHSLGHGVGIDIHEGVCYSPREDRIVEKDMVITVEPGVYIDNEFGVRIEDMGLLDDKKVNSLTKTNKNLIII